MKPFSTMFSSVIEKDDFYEGLYFIKIFHKESKFVILSDYVFSKVESVALSKYKEMMSDYFNDDVLFVIAGLSLYRKKGIHLKHETVDQVFDELLGIGRG